MAALTPIFVDISHWDTMESNGFEKLQAANYRGVIHKATEGPGLVDVTYAPRRRDCGHTSLKQAAYHFARRGDGVTQADHFLDVVQPDDDVLLVLDWESAAKNFSDTLTIPQAKAFLERVMVRTGRPPEGIWIYGGNVLKELITSAEDIAYFGRFPLWLCEYGPNAILPKAWARYTAWQFTGDGRGPGPHTAPGVFHPQGVDNNVVCDGFDWDKHWGACKWALAAPEIVATTAPTLEEQLSPIINHIPANTIPQAPVAFFKAPTPDPTTATKQEIIAASSRLRVQERVANFLEYSFAGGGISFTMFQQVRDFVTDLRSLAVLVIGGGFYGLIKWSSYKTHKEAQQGRYTPSGMASENQNVQNP